MGAGTTTERLLRQMNERDQLGVNILLAPDINEGFLMLESGRVAALMQEDIGLYAVGARVRDPARWTVVGDALQPEGYGCMLRKGDAQFKKLVDDTILEMMRNGELRALYEKYFNAPLNLRNVSLRCASAAPHKKVERVGNSLYTHHTLRTTVGRVYNPPPSPHPSTQP